MGFVSDAVNSIGGAISGAVNTIGSVVESAASGVIDGAKGILGGISDGFVDTIGGGLKSLVGGLPFVGGLLTNLIDKGEDWAKGGLRALEGGGFNALQGMLDGLIGQVTGRPLENGSVVNAPTLTDRGNASNSAATNDAVNTSAEAATGASSSTAAGNDSTADAIKGLAGGQVTGKELAEQYGQDYSKKDVQKQFDMMAIQKNEAMMQQLFQMISTIMKNRDDTAMGIIRNMKA